MSEFMKVVQDNFLTIVACGYFIYLFIEGLIKVWRGDGE